MKIRDIALRKKTPWQLGCGVMVVDGRRRRVRLHFENSGLIRTLITLAALVLTFTFTQAAPDEKAAPSTAPLTNPAAAKPPKPIGFDLEASEVTTTGFTHTLKDGAKETMTVTDKTTITSDGKTPAKLADIKVGDMVAGSRIKTGEGQYTLIKITKFGPKRTKPSKAAPVEPGDNTPNPHPIKKR